MNWRATFLLACWMPWAAQAATQGTHTDPVPSVMWDFYHKQLLGQAAFVFDDRVKRPRGKKYGRKTSQIFCPRRCCVKRNFIGTSITKVTGPCETHLICAQSDCARIRVRRHRSCSVV